MSKTARAYTILGTVEDGVSNLLYYDRKEDEDLPLGAIDEAVRLGEVTIDEIVDLFRTKLCEGLAK
jgi:hypothetical protein